MPDALMSELPPYLVLAALFYALCIGLIFSYLILKGLILCHTLIKPLFHKR
jgi:hypothetical protein